MAERRDLLLMYKEILHNIANHARATAVTIELDVRGGDLVLRIADDGLGFGDTDQGNGTGLKSLRKRAARLRAELRVKGSPGGGTLVELTMKPT
jgi:signal transduction histidine kinase